MASAIDLTLDDDDSVELMGPPVTDLTADSQDSLPPRRAPAAAAGQRPHPWRQVATGGAGSAAGAEDAAPAGAGPPPAPPPWGRPPRREAKFSYFDTRGHG